jgi:hypothetical protein
MGFCFDVLIIQEGVIVLQEAEQIILAAGGGENIKNSFFRGHPEPRQRTTSSALLLETHEGCPIGINLRKGKPENKAPEVLD